MTTTDRIYTGLCESCGYMRTARGVPFVLSEHPTWLVRASSWAHTRPGRVCIDCLPGAHDDLCQTCGAGTNEDDTSDDMARDVDVVACDCVLCTADANACGEKRGRMLAGDCPDPWHANDEATP